MLSLKHIILGGKTGVGVGGGGMGAWRTTKNNKESLAPPAKLPQKPEPSTRHLNESPTTACPLPFPRDTGGLNRTGHWELRGEALGTLNLVGWLCGTLSLSRQLQQLPMVSEQPVHPRERRDEQVTSTWPSSSQKTDHCTVSASVLWQRPHDTDTP